MSWNQVFIPLCYRYFLLNQKKRRYEICISQISGPGMKKEMALKWRFQSFVQPANSFQKFTQTNSKKYSNKIH